MNRSVCCSLIVVSLFTTVLISCSRDPNVRKQKYFESGQRYFEKGKYQEALIQFSNAVQVDSRYADAHYQLAQVYIKLQKWTPAYQELARTVELQPDNYPARLDLANLLIAGHELKLAQEQTDFLLKEQPKNPLAHAAASRLLAAQENFPAALNEMQTAIGLSPDRWDLLLALASLQMKANLPDAAEPNFKKAIELNPKSTGPRLALAEYYQFRGRF